MLINRANMDALFQTYNAAFTAAMQAAQVRVFDNQLMFEDFAMSIPSTGAATLHTWLNQLPGMKEWVGERVKNNVGAGKLTVTNRPFESTVTVKRDDIEDDQYGMFTPMIGAMGAAAEKLWLELTMSALVTNGDWADANPFFCAKRVLSDQSGLITNAVTTALGKDAIEAGIAAMLSWKLHGGQPADVMPRILLVGPSLLATAKSIVEAIVLATGASNTSPAKLLQVRMDPRLVGDHAAKWYILGEKNTIKAVAAQKRKLPVLTRQDRDTDPDAFNKGEYNYGTDARGEGFLTFPFLAYAGGLASVEDFSAA
jgi:phage major head subunit gpT-like protein